MSIFKCLKFLAPHLLSILKDAVAKWNDQVPSDQEEDFWKDYDRIALKVAKLPSYDECLHDKVVELRDKDPSPEILVELTKVTKNHLDGLFGKISKDLISAYVHRDQEIVMEVYHRINKMGEGFQCSMSVDLLLNNQAADARHEIRIIDDALLALDRVYPSRKIAPSGTLILRDLVSVNHMSISPDDLAEMKIKFKSLYDFRVVQGYTHPTSVCLTPKCAYISEDVLQEIYGISLKDLSIYDLVRAEQNCDDWFVKNDPNISIQAIMSKISGSAMTSLSTVICDLVTWVSSVYLSKYNCTPEVALQKTRENLWNCVPDAMLFISPHMLYACMAEMNTNEARLTEDFKMMTKIMELYRIYKANFSTVSYDPAHARFARPSYVTSPRQGHFYPSTTTSARVSTIESGGRMFKELHNLLGLAGFSARALRVHGATDHANQLEKAREDVYRVLNLPDDSNDW